MIIIKIIAKKDLTIRQYFESYYLITSLTEEQQGMGLVLECGCV